MRIAKIGIIGTGHISEIYCENLTNVHENTEIIAVADVNREAAEQKAAKWNIPYVLSVEELLDSCIENLQQLGDTEDITPEALQQLWRNREFAELFTMMARVAETALWETEHNARWIACLEAVRDAWLAAQD